MDGQSQCHQAGWIVGSLQLHGINTFKSFGADANAAVFFCLLLHFLFPGGHLVCDVVIIITLAKQISVV